MGPRYVGWMGNTAASIGKPAPAIQVNEGLARTDEGWKALRDRAIRALATGHASPQDIDLLARAVLEYERSTRDFKRQNDQITELQEKLNGWVKKDRLARGILE